MNYSNYFALQMNDYSNLASVRCLEMKLRCLKGPDGFFIAIKHAQNNHPERFEHDWVAPLLAAIKPYYKPLDPNEPDGDYTHPLSEFLEDTLKKLSNGKCFLFAKNFNLENFTEEELSQPHMLWVSAFMKRYSAMLLLSPQYAIRLAAIHPFKNVNDTVLLELNNDFLREQIGSISFAEYVNWYVKSRGHFLIENEKLDPEYAQKMKKTLISWNDSEEKSFETHCYWLARNYEFHPKHEPFLQNFIRETLDLK